jgi:hypothetical protein
MGAGQRTIAVPTRRHLRTPIVPLGSNTLKRLPTARNAGTNVSATETATSIPTAHGTPRVWNSGIRVKLRQKTAPAIVKPEAKTTGATPRYVV